jgi:hypothetical protein
MSPANDSRPACRGTPSYRHEIAVAEVAVAVAGQECQGAAEDGVVVPLDRPHDRGGACGPARPAERGREARRRWWPRRAAASTTAARVEPRRGGAAAVRPCRPPRRGRGSPTTGGSPCRRTPEEDQRGAGGMVGVSTSIRRRRSRPPGRSRRRPRRPGRSRAAPPTCRHSYRMPRRAQRRKRRGTDGSRAEFRDAGSSPL